MLPLSLGNLGAGLISGVRQVLSSLPSAGPAAGSDQACFSPETAGVDPRQQRLAQLQEEIMETQLGRQMALAQGDPRGAAEAEQRLQCLQAELAQLTGGDQTQGQPQGMPDLGSNFAQTFAGPCGGGGQSAFGGGPSGFGGGPAGFGGGPAGFGGGPADNSPSLAPNAAPAAGPAELGRLKTLQGAQTLQDGSLAFQAGAAIDVDGVGGSHGDPCKQWETSLRTKDGKSLNADTTPYFVLPPQVAKQYGIKPGDLGTITYNGKTIPAVFGDVGPKNKIGEISRYAAQQLGINASPTRGGVPKGVSYNVFPGSGSRRPSADSVTAGALAQRVGSHQTMLAQRSGASSSARNLA